MTLAKHIPRSAIGAGLVLMLAVSALAYASNQLLASSPYHHGYVVLDAVGLGAFCGALVWAYEERHNRVMAEKLEIIAEMNHRVRNELQVIQYSAYFTKDREHMERISQCLSRIETALREVLPGKTFLFETGSGEVPGADEESNTKRLGRTGN